MHGVSVHTVALAVVVVVRRLFIFRGQVLLAEAWASDPFFTGISIVSCHPGWTDTPGLEGWIGRGKAALAPLRTLWQVRLRVRVRVS